MRMMAISALATILAGCGGVAPPPSTPAPAVPKAAPTAVAAAPAPVVSPAPPAAVEPAPTAATAPTPAAVPAAAPAVIKAEGETLPAVTVPVAPAAPVIDGDLGDPCWAAAPVLELVDIQGRADIPLHTTRVRILADANALFVAFDCAEDPGTALLDSVKVRDDEVWVDDAVELFLLPGTEAGPAYYHILVNADGTIADEKERDITAWNAAGLTAAVKRLDDRWQVEICLPWADLDPADLPLPRQWRLNCTRGRPAREGGELEDQAWSPTLSTSSHVPDRFGHLTLEIFPPAE
ncbi:MAG: carbohydrate-binding family 9-like protein [Planctomycetota bacterium]